MGRQGRLPYKDRQVAEDGGGIQLAVFDGDFGSGQDVADARRL
jgi:hypothetical protein